MQNILVFSGDSHSPLSFKNFSIAGFTNFIKIFLLLAITMKSSAYLTTFTASGILVFLPSFNLIGILWSTDLVSPSSDSFTDFSRPFNVKLARLGDIIPPIVPERDT